ncbi:hypothetical protein [Synechococcus sp. PCC 7336]|uniref:hypothetical protein n=1 Tax=Synechococcus sp. PCC 7336 TaxID=195250 RepID=UPI00034CCE52|nr:hypothetical protein [Synechococcus sp. PCC 7336]
MTDSQSSPARSHGWYIVQQPDGHCTLTPTPAENARHWGPFDTEGEAIARRVGLIRSGTCKPV